MRENRAFFHGREASLHADSFVRRHERLILVGLFFGSIVFLPWFVSVCFGLILLFLFNAPEVIAGGFLHDLLYAAPKAAFWDVEFVGTASALFLFVLFLITKKYLIFYREE